MNNHCPVQASLNRYLADCEAADALGDAIDDRKEELMKRVDAKDIYDAMDEVAEDKELMATIARVFRRENYPSRVSLTDAEEIISGLFAAIERSIEKLAEHQIKKEWGNNHDH